MATWYVWLNREAGLAWYARSQVRPREQHRCVVFRTEAEAMRFVQWANIVPVDDATAAGAEPVESIEEMHERWRRASAHPRVVDLRSRVRPLKSH